MPSIRQPYLAAAALLLLVAARPAAGQAIPRPAPDPRVARIVSSISETRLRTLVDRLAAFGTRHTLSDTTSSTRGIGAARQFIYDELARSNPRLQVAFATFRVARQGRITRDVELRNVVALLPGRSARRIYVTAHYDTVSIGPQGAHGPNTRPAGQPAPPDPQLDASQDYDVDAPGANDNASGTALTMELARALASADVTFDATLVFVLWAGEEQGLIGARAQIHSLAIDEVVIDAAFNNDIVGNSHGGDGARDARSVRVYAAGPEDSMSRALARHVQRAAATYVPAHRVRIMAREDRFGRASDHSAFTENFYPAVVFREAAENFLRQHSPSDTADGVDVRYLAQNARVNAAAAASLALAPPAPAVTTIVNGRFQPTIGRQPSGYDANLRWAPAPGAASYRIYWRDAWTPDWQHSVAVGNVTSHVLEGMSIDNHVFGVAAVGAAGHQSLISAYVAQPRSEPDVSLLP